MSTFTFHTLSKILLIIFTYFYLSKVVKEYDYGNATWLYHVIQLYLAILLQGQEEGKQETINASCRNYVL